jgi:2-polyprenyl-3-methyl-5-hydroxy-6-metoxy-1,4-benzoquinol methylase
MTTEVSREPTYLMGRSEAETRRLIAQHRLYGSFTRRLLEDAGIQEDMRVLDVGSGAGDVALLAAELVGPTGSVVGVDQDPEVLKTASARAEASGLTNVSFHAGDFREGVPGDSFDAVVGRLVLLYVPDPAEVLRNLVERLEPGGIVAFGEFNFLPESVVSHPPTPTFESLWAWMQAVVRGIGLDPATGYHLRDTFLKAGLPEPEMSLCSPVGGGPDYLGYDHGAESLRSMLPLILKLGIATEEQVAIDTLADRLRAEATASGSVRKNPDLVGAWTRKR